MPYDVLRRWRETPAIPNPISYLDIVQRGVGMARPEGFQARFTDRVCELGEAWFARLRAQRRMTVAPCTAGPWREG
jgi:hypothetical protein